MHVLSKMVLLIAATSIAFSPILLRSDNVPSCSDLAKVDFANIAIDVPGSGPVKLNNRKGYTQVVVINGKSVGSGWEVTIQDDMILNPVAGVTLRLIALNVAQLTGTDAKGYALIYECTNGRLHRMFESMGYLYGVELKKIDETTFTIGYGIYTKDDALCCPSMKSTDTYTWNGREGQFNMVKSVKGPANAK